MLHQRQAKRYVDFKEGKYVFSVKDEQMRETEIERQKEVLKKLEDIVDCTMVSGHVIFYIITKIY